MPRTVTPYNFYGSRGAMVRNDPTQRARRFGAYANTAYRVGKAAYNVYKTAQNESKPKAGRKPRTLGTMSQSNGRAVRKTTGRKKVKSIQHRRKKVKVSHNFRKKVKKVVAGTQHHGTTYSTRQGTIGMITTNNAITNEFRPHNQGGYDASVINVKPLDQCSANTRCWWQTAYTGNDSIQNGNEFQWFTPMKIIDAASILWNQKTGSSDYRLQAGNLNTIHNGTTGALVSGTPTSMEITGLKIHIVNCYVKMNMKNNSQRSMLITVYKCVPKSLAPLELPLETFVDACDREADGVNTSLTSVIAPGTIDAKSSLSNNPAVQPNHFKSFNSEWKYEKVAIKLAPGETTSLFFQGPKDYTLDYDKLNKGVENIQHLCYKNTSMVAMISVQPDLVFSTGTPVGTGRLFQNQGSIGFVNDMISCEWTEVYKLRMPDIVGFQNGPAADSGNMYTLNKRLNRKAYNNFVDAHDGLADPVYTAYDEENPGDNIPGGRTN